MTQRERKERRQKILRRRRRRRKMIRNLRVSIIIILLVSVVIASTRYNLYKNSPDYIISEEFLEQYNNIEDDSNTTDDSSSTSTASAKRLNTLNSSVYNFEATATEVSIVANSEVASVTSSNSEQQCEQYEIIAIDATTYYCAADNTLNVRNYPSTSGEILGSVNRGEELVVCGFVYFDSSSWAEISYNGTYAFVSTDFLSEVKVSKYSQSDIYLFAQILYAEAGGCDSAEMARVGQVVLNRINTDYKEFTCCIDIPSTLYHSGAYPDTVKKIENGLEPSQEALQVAEGLLNGTIQSNIGEDVYWQTGFVPEWEVEIVYVSEWGHYYSKIVE